jgi:3-phosphoshikimate 1-carboxyvinyltransferase
MLLRHVRSRADKEGRRTVEYVSARPGSPLRGEVAVPGDKSLSHRAVLFAATATGTSRLEGVLDSEDVRSTIAAVRALGAGIDLEERTDGSLSVSVTGWGEQGPRDPGEPIDCGNSGTTARLLLGLLAGWDVQVTLTGDASLSKRPMGRVIDPLTTMGASFESAGGTLPLTVRGGDLSAIEYASPIASAQVKTAILLAGLRADGRTTVREPARSRDHTEMLLPAFGVPVGRDLASCAAWVDGPARLRAADVAVPGDPSSAAFIVAAGLLVPGSRLTITGVGLNPTRIAFLDVLERMGAEVTLQPTTPAGAEPVGSIHVRHTDDLRATVVHGAEVPGLVDEIPVLALLATQAHGTTRFEDVGELRVKESDRLAAIIDGLTILGASACAEGDTLVVEGGARLKGGGLRSMGDHRLAMTWALAGLAAASPVNVGGFEAVHVSYPGFVADLTALGAGS